MDVDSKESQKEREWMMDATSILSVRTFTSVKSNVPNTQLTMKS